MNKKRMALSVFWIIIGVILFVLALMQIIDQSMWAGIGGGLIGAGAAMLIRNIK